jgi:hypothetical protein
MMPIAVGGLKSAVSPSLRVCVCVCVCVCGWCQKIVPIDCCASSIRRAGRTPR